MFYHSYKVHAHHHLMGEEQKYKYFDIEHLLKVDAARPWEILAITFTNKAAGELKERLEKMVKEEMESVLKLAIPLIADCNGGKNWLEAH